MFKKGLKGLALPLVIILLAYAIYAFTRPVPQVGPVSQISSVPKTTAINLPWPAGGQSAIGAAGYGILADHNSANPVPVASIAKIITALAILRQKPITSGQGPVVTLDQTDADFFNSYYAKDGSVVQVNVGEQITEYQALQAMLIPSANNIADSMARWAFGSVDSYVAYANQMVKSLGLINTTVGDASGFGDNTTSTADDLVKLGIAALNNPSIASIVSQSSAQIPVAGTVKNVNFLLGTDGVDGIKTGNTDKAGGCYLFAARRTILGHTVNVVGAILAQPDLINTIRSAQPLIETADQGFEQITVVHKDQIMGNYQSPWGAAAQFKSPKDLALMVWKGQDIKILNEPDAVNAPVKSGESIGKLTVQSGQQTAKTNLVLYQDLPNPSWTWRLLH
jgi:D-alanyl-D-alanine carboxypeptidase (penicillin-binding protein 5/6)